MRGEGLEEGIVLRGGRRARGRVTPGPGVITMRTRMLELFDEFQTRCVALMEGNVTLYRTVFHLLGFLSLYELLIGLLGFILIVESN